jgi:AbrB family looped-hinge helix DNA binding protein
LTVEQFIKGRITIPKDVIKHLDLKENDYVEWRLGGGFNENVAAILKKKS